LLCVSYPQNINARVIKSKGKNTLFEKYKHIL